MYQETETEIVSTIREWFSLRGYRKVSWKIIIFKDGHWNIN